MKNPIFKLNNLVYNHKSSNLMNIKNFEIHRGACYIINGNMGSGKTLLLDILSKQNKNYKGDVFYESKEISSYSNKNFNKDVYYVKQSFSPPYFKNVEQFLNSVSRNNSLAKNKSKNLDSLISKMDFKYLVNNKMRELTPSQLRWVNLAGGLASFPKVLLIDELELHLGSNNMKILSKLLFRKSNYEGITIIATTQNKELFKNLSSVNINLNNGRITSVRSNAKRNYSKKNK